VEHNPKISVICPVYNTEKYLPRCVESILSQTFSGFECVLVDDCSPDKSPILCDKYAEKDGRVRVIHNKQNKGSSLARKIGLAASRGAYILFADSDDWLEPDMLEKLYRTAVDGNFDMVCCDYYDCYENRNYVKLKKTNFISSDNNFIIRQIIAEQFEHTVWSKLVKRSVYRQVVFPRCSWAEDRVITIQAVYYAQSIGYIGENLYHYSINNSSLSNNSHARIKKIKEEYENWAMTLHFLEEKYGGDLADFEPYISDYTNGQIKTPSLTCKETRDMNMLFTLYPRSNACVFNKTSKLPYIYKIFMYMATKKIIFQYKILDIVWYKSIGVLYYKLRNFYRLYLKK
jgi:glycosyltransferase involved in cell wall biosynthesis